MLLLWKVSACIVTRPDDREHNCCLYLRPVWDSLKPSILKVITFKSLGTKGWTKCVQGVSVTRQAFCLYLFNGLLLNPLASFVHNADCSLWQGWAVCDFWKTRFHDIFKNIENSTEYVEPKDSPEPKLQVKYKCSIGVFNILGVIGKTIFQKQRNAQP